MAHSPAGSQRRPLGYYVEYDEQRTCTLTVVIRESPTGQHFDPEEMRLDTAASPAGIEQLVVSHPWSGVRTHRACAGRILIEDRRQNRVEMFTFGGELTISTEGGETTCRLISPAPIIELIEEMLPQTFMVYEVEVLLAQRRAASLMHHGYYEERLASIDPLTLYAACLHALHQQYASPLRTESDDELALLQLVHSEIRAVEHIHGGPLDVPSLETLL